MNERHRTAVTSSDGTTIAIQSLGSGEGVVTLAAEEAGTRLTYRYRADVGGKVAAVGQRLLGTATRVLIADFFHALEQRIAPRAVRMPRWLALLAAVLRGRR